MSAFVLVIASIAAPSMSAVTTGGLGIVVVLGLVVAMGIIA